MKKFISMILASVMVIGSASTAMAADEVDVKIKKIPVASSYTAYKLLDAVAVDGAEGSAKYRYTLPSNEAENAALLSAFTDIAKDESLWGEGKVWSNAEGKTFDDILQSSVGSSNQNSINTAIYDMIDSTFADRSNDDTDWEHTLVTKTDADTFAAAMLEKVKNNANIIHKEFTVPALEATDKGDAVYATNPNWKISPGYYLFVQTDGTGSSGDYSGSTSLYMLNTAVTGSTLTINPKVSAPEVNKQVFGADYLPALSETGMLALDTEHMDTTPGLGGFGDVTVAGSSNSIVTFRVVGTLPQTFDAYDTYTYVFHDKMENMTILREKQYDTQYLGGVYMYDAVSMAGNPPDVKDMTDITEYFKYWDTPNGGDKLDMCKGVDGEDPCNVHFGCGDVKKIPGITKDHKIVLYYKAVLDGEDAVQGTPGNPNTVKIEYSNNPYQSGEGRTEPDVPGPDPTEPTPPDTAVVFTFDTIVNKVDESNNPLKGAEFTLEVLAVNMLHSLAGEGIQSVAEQNIIGGVNDVVLQQWHPVDVFEVRDENTTTFNFKSLAPGYYRLSETKVPDGYNGIDDIYFEIRTEEKEVDGKQSLVAKFVTVKLDDAKIKEATDKLIAGGDYAAEDLEGCVWFFTEVSDTDANKFAQFTVQLNTNTTDNIDGMGGIGTTTVVNKPGRLLPTTGGAGTTALYVGGIVMLLAAGCVLVFKKKKSNE